MSNLHEKLRSHHHLKHAGRMQYGLYLKGIGLSLEDALEFWQGHFTKAMSGEEFLKKYAYNIRHNYGKEGKRTDYTPYSCTKIIGGSKPGTGEFHGCPFAHWDAGAVKLGLERLRLSDAQVEDVMESVTNRHYQVACRKHFEAKHPGALSDDVGNHPNAWFAASAEHYKKKEGGTTTGASGAGGGAASTFTAPKSS